MKSALSSSLVMVFAAGFLSIGSVAANTMKTTTLCLADHPHQIQVEVAETLQQKARGLMMRESLPEHAGMWFRYDQERPADAGFWMFNTWIPLDIAYMDEDMRIVKIIQMQPCETIIRENCPAYDPGVSYHSALEVNHGYFDRFGIEVGDQLKQCE